MARKGTTFPHHLQKLANNLITSKSKYWKCVFQGMIALRREATELCHEDYMDAIMEVQAKKKANLNYYA